MRVHGFDRILDGLRDGDASARLTMLDRLIRYPLDRARPRRYQLDRARAVLVALLRTDASPEVRKLAAHALQWHAASWPALVAALTDAAEAPAVRGQAAESLSTLGHLRRGARRVVPALVAGLEDPAPEVRFWCVYTLGQLRIDEAAPAIEKLGGDAALCPGWWTVGEEAADALAYLRGGAWPARERRPAP